MKLAGRSAIITGASLGLGAAIAEAFAAEGAALMLCARNAADLEAQRAKPCRGLSNARALRRTGPMWRSRKTSTRLFAAAANAFGKLDIVVNNAGVYGPMGTIDTIDWDEWVQAIAINLNGLVYCCRKAVEAFKPHRYGKIINLSGGGATNPLPGISAYAASKAAVVRFTETLALEVKEFGIDVNAVAPGALATRSDRPARRRRTGARRRQPARAHEQAGEGRRHAAERGRLAVRLSRFGGERWRRPAG